MDKKWWKEAIVYQIYPKSFYDSNGDGIGDIKGIISKLDYLKFLGVNVIWLCPVYESPNDDNGYDISDYYSVMKEYGTMPDLDELLSELHKREMKLIMDMVVNHTSDEHPWFVEAKASVFNEKRDYYIWRQGKNGREPNNWRSYFGGSAWEFDEKSGEYYLHLFSKKQPDLNWKNSKVKHEIIQMMRWWLNKGVDGFRLDVINLLCKAQGLPDSNRCKPEFEKYIFDEDLYANQPGIHELLKELNEEVFSLYDCMTVGEVINVNTDTGLMYVDESRKELNMIFQFELMGVDTGADGKWNQIPWNVSDFKRIAARWQKELHGRGWNSLFLNNHDNPRALSRFGDDGEYREKAAKMLATFIFTLEGTPFIYQGEEIGMTNVRFSGIEDYRDIETLNFYKEKVLEGGNDLKEIMCIIHKRSRDNARTPMQWNSSKNAGFTSGIPWIKLNPNYKDINTEKEMKDENSILNYYREIIKLRKANPVLIYGEYIPLFDEHPSVISYIRCLNEERVLVVMNFCNESSFFDMKRVPEFQKKELLLSNYPESDLEIPDELMLKPFEACIYRLL